MDHERAAGEAYSRPRPGNRYPIYEHTFGAHVTDRSETAALIALLRTGDVPWTRSADLVEEAGSAVLALEHVLSGGDRPALFGSGAEPDLHAVETELATWEAEGMQVLTVLDERYPANLRTVFNRPPLLFVAGTLSSGDERSVAVVGTRKASTVGLAQAEEVTGVLVDAGYTIVSGLAAGIDAVAHKAALARGVRTVAIIGTGLRRRYPAENAVLQERIGAEGAVISQFWPDHPPTRTTFPLRNAVMSGFARATVVVEASGISGARMQARLASEHGRPVFLLESLREHEWAHEAAARPGTRFVSEPAAIAEQLDRLAAPEAVFA